MNIVTLNVKDLTPYDRNPRKNGPAVDKVAASIKEFGFKVPIVIDKDHVVVCGHTRLLAAKKLGLQEVPCVVADDLNEEQIKAFRLADNKVSEFSEWDMDFLNMELGGITDIDMSAFGFDTPDNTVVDEDDFEMDNLAPAIARKGDIYLLGDHKLMCGDSTNAFDVETLMGGVQSRFSGDGSTL